MTAAEAAYLIWLARNLAPLAGIAVILAAAITGLLLVLASGAGRRRP
jgi:UPF0716 family protein affecting phage T7 exclusion